jgi:uncharacterized protein (TIGR02246 family)
MKLPLQVLLAAAAAAGTLAAPAQAQNRPGQMSCQPVTQAQVEAQFQRFNSAWATKNPDRVTSLFSRNAVLLPTVSNQPRTDHAGIRDYFVKFLANSPQGRINTSTVKLGCNAAARLGTWSVTMDGADGRKQTVHARYSFIYVFENGDWKIDHLHSSLNPEPMQGHAPSR